MTANDRHRGLREALANVQQRMIELEARRATVVRAPISGRIAAIPALAGAAVDSGNLIATVVPDSAELRARLSSCRPAPSARSIPGRPSRSAMTPSPTRSTAPSRAGSRTWPTPSCCRRRSRRVSPVKANEPAYVLDVVLERQHVARGGDRHAHLRPDMLFSATIEVDRRPILAWIGESVFGVAQR